MFYVQTAEHSSRIKVQALPAGLHQTAKAMRDFLPTAPDIYTLYNRHARSSSGAVPVRQLEVGR